MRSNVIFLFRKPWDCEKVVGGEGLKIRWVDDANQKWKISLKKERFLMKDYKLFLMYTA